MIPAELLPFEQQLATAWPSDGWRDVSLLAAVSGGADSVAMLRGLAKLKNEAGGAGRLIVAHFNHRLRAQADDDAEFVRSLAADLQLPFELGGDDVRTASAVAGDGLESAARQARYRFLCQAAGRCGARYVATAHTADDHVETVLFNVLRGTGLAGVAGIPRARSLSPAVSVIRPLLELSRRDVERYLQALGQSFRTDESNRCADFTRNRLRHELLPLLRQNYPFDIDRSLSRLGKIAGDAQQWIEQQAAELLERCLSPSSTRQTAQLDVRPLLDEPPHLVREMFVQLWRQNDWPLQAMGFDQWQSLAQLAIAPSGTSSLPGSVRAQRRDDHFWLTRN